MTYGNETINAVFNPESIGRGTAEKLGLTKREYFAGLAMQGWIACQSENFNSLTDPQNIVSKAVECADLLIAELNKESK